MEISKILKIKKGITSVIGAGGKTTLINTLAEELSANGKVVITTTTHIMKPNQIPTIFPNSIQEIKKAFENTKILCIGSQDKNGKLIKPIVSFEDIDSVADYILVEADGAKRLPLKAHADYEQNLVPKLSSKLILVIGIDGLYHKINEVCHRPQLYAKLSDATPDSLTTPEIVAKAIKKENFYKPDMFLINKVESKENFEIAKQLADKLEQKTIIGSLHQKIYTLSEEI